MILCPDCQRALSDIRGLCVCGFQAPWDRGVPIFLSSRELDDSLSIRYSENYERIAKDDVAHGILDSRFVENRAKKLASRLGDLSGLDVCDVGSGKGSLSRALLAAGAAKVTCVDIARTYLGDLVDQTGLNPVNANAENLPFRAEFDLLTTTDVLEHVLNAGAAMFCANRALKIGGRFVVRVPHRESLLQYSPQMGCGYDLVHLRSFDEPVVRAYLVDAGFEIETFYLDGFWPGTPQPFWQGARTSLWYRSIIDRSLAQIEHEGNFTRWPAWIARALMRPLEIVCIARKVRDLEAGIGAVPAS